MSTVQVNLSSHFDSAQQLNRGFESDAQSSHPDKAHFDEQNESKYAGTVTVAACIALRYEEERSRRSCLMGSW